MRTTYFAWKVNMNRHNEQALKINQGFAFAYTFLNERNKKQL